MVHQKDEIKKQLQHFQNKLPETDFDDTIVNDAADCIHTHLFVGKLTVAWMKQKCGIKGDFFSVRFKICLGYYPKAYILHHRIEAGKILLETTGATVTAIAAALGFNSVSAFCNSFRQKTGHWPSKWRAKHQN